MALKKSRNTVGKNVEKSPIRYVATHIGEQGLRQLTRACQGRLTFATPEEAQHWLDAVLKNNTEKEISDAWGKQAVGTFEVRPVECYKTQNGELGDPKGIYFD